jgi:hypothetical protein
MRTRAWAIVRQEPTFGPKTTEQKLEATFQSFLMLVASTNPMQLLHLAGPKCNLLSAEDWNEHCEEPPAKRLGSYAG